MRKFSIFLFAGLTVACGRPGPSAEGRSGEAPVDGPGSAVSGPDKEPAASAAEMVFDGPGALLPKTVAGWAVSRPPRYFGPDDLYDLIDGGADIYVAYGLVRMVTIDYGSPSRKGVTVTLEIYDQGSPLGAFGRMSRFLAGRADPSAAGAGLPAALAGKGLLGSGDLLFWKDRYLVHATLLDESPAATADSLRTAGLEILPPFAAAVSAAIAADPPAPAEFERFPAEDRLGRSELYAAEKLAGLAALEAGFEVRYRKDGAEWTLFASVPLADDAAAAAAAREAVEAAGERRAIQAVAAGRRVVGCTVMGNALSDPAVTGLKQLAARFAAPD